MAEEKKESIAQEFEGGFMRMEQFVEENQKGVMIGGGIALVIAAALVYVFAMYLPGENTKAQKEMYMAEFAFAKDSFAVALNGTPAYKGFADVASKYGMTHAGKLANYYAGICCLNLKKYDDAIKYLDKFSTSDPIIGAIRLNDMGDAYAQLGKMDDAVNYYQKAANFSDNESYTPYFLMKAGMAYEHQKKNDDAKKCYDKVKEKYPTSDEGRDIEKYIARVSAGSN